MEGLSSNWGTRFPLAGTWMTGRCWTGRRRRGPGWAGSARTPTSLPQPRLMDIPGPDNNRSRLGAGRAQQEDLRRVRPVHRRVPHRGDCRSLCHRNARCISYQTSRTGADTARTQAANAGLGIRLRHLPGRMSGEPQGRARRFAIMGPGAFRRGPLMGQQRTGQGPSRPVARAGCPGPAGVGGDH